VPLITFTARYISLLEALKIVPTWPVCVTAWKATSVMIVPPDAPIGEIIVRT